MLDLENNSLDLDLFKRVLQEIKNEPDRYLDIIDSFSANQFESKGKLLELIDKLDFLTADSSITIFGCWYGSILIPALAPKVKKIIAIDLDDMAIRIGKNRFFKNFENVFWSTEDIFTKYRKGYSETTLFINTSCEHMLPMKEWPWWKELKADAYFAFVSNNMDYVDGHINCVYSLDEFQTQLPQNFTVLHKTEIVEKRGSKYLLVGKIFS